MNQPEEQDQPFDIGKWDVASNCQLDIRLAPTYELITSVDCLMILSSGPYVSIFRNPTIFLMN